MSIIVCNDDIDPSNLKELVWMLGGRHDLGDRGNIRIEDRMNWPFSPYINPDFGNYPAGWKATRLVLNCLPPEGVPHPPRTTFEVNCPKDLKSKILANWESDGFPPHSGPVAAPSATDQVTLELRG